jgi:hypothetical protein
LREIALVSVALIDMHNDVIVGWAMSRMIKAILAGSTRLQGSCWDAQEGS